MSRRGPSHAGPYALACTNCFKAKSRCIARPGASGAACERCFRLSKDCHPSEAMRRSSTAKRKSSNAKIAELESKVESLLTQLQSRNADEAGGVEKLRAATVRRRRKTRVTSPDNAPIYLHPELSSTPGIQAISEEENFESGSDPQPGGSTSLDIDSAVTLAAFDADTRAQDLVAMFRTEILCSFPFMHLPAAVTAEQIQTQWPILFQAIVSVASRHGTQAPSQAPRLKRVIYDAMLDFDENPTNLKRIDLLLAMLTYLAWGCDHVLYCGSMPRLMLQVASLASEMMQTDAIDPGERTMTKPTAWLFDHDNKRDPRDDTTRDLFLDKRRAILGCFVLSSAVSAYFGRVNAVRWTMKMEESLAAISMNKECPTDKAFALQVEVQCLAEKAVDIHRRQDTVFHKTIGVTGSPKIASLLSLQTQLQELKASLSPIMPHVELCVAQSSSVELTLNEITYAATCALPSLIKHIDKRTGTIAAGTLLDGTANAASVRRDQEATLWRCLESSKTCLMAFMDLAPSNFCNLSFVQWVQLARSIACLHHLTNTIEDPTWDKDNARLHVNLPRLLDQVMGKLKLAAQLSGRRSPDNVFARLSQKISEIRTGMSSVLIEQQETEQEEDTSEELLRGDRATKDGPWSYDYVLG